MHVKIGANYDVLINLFVFAAGKLCKHFMNYGCKLGARCRFLHCKPEDMNKMASDPGFVPGHHRGRGGRFEGPPGTRFEARNGETFALQSGPPLPHPTPLHNIPLCSSPPSSGHQVFKSSPPAAVVEEEEGGLVMEEGKAGHEESAEQKQINL